SIKRLKNGQHIELIAGTEVGGFLLFFYKYKSENEEVYPVLSTSPWE
ncbi:TPA: hypothetical protein U5487_001925, partial [Legionella pneumophila]|nr:hypothetical protein [Legionella pneumophila]